MVYVVYGKWVFAYVGICSPYGVCLGVLVVYVHTPRGMGGVGPSNLRVARAFTWSEPILVLSKME